MPITQRNEKYLDIADVCERYGIGRTTLYRWMKEPSFPASVTIRKRRYFSDLALARWEAERGGEDPDMPSRLHGLKPVSGVINDYQDFVDAMIKRRSEIGISSMELDARSGMQEGYVSKLENFGRPQGRGMGPEVFPLWLGGLKVGVVLVELPRRPRKKGGSNADR